MNRLNKSAAIEQMNIMGHQSTPFFFVIDFEMQKIIISANNQLSDGLSIDFPSFKSFQNQTVKSLDWIKVPMLYENYEKDFQKVMREIQAGNTFLINLTHQTPIYCNGTLLDIFHSASAKYKVCLKDEFTMFSPETFVKIEDGYIYTYPMKGTADSDEPDALERLIFDEKEVAEHYTIVDLLRNDLSIVAKEVEVTKFRYPEYLHTNTKNLIQTSSEIQGKLPENYKSHLGDILFSLLAAGSVSGAPKKKTVEIIADVEGCDRGYYTGICGYFDGTNLDSAVIIRYIEQLADNTKVYRSGCGITFQSEAKKEYEEMIDKVYLPSKKLLKKHIFKIV